MSGTGSNNSDRNEEYQAPSALGFGVVWLHDLGWAISTILRSKLNMRSSCLRNPHGHNREIGLVSSLGGWFASDGENYHKMQMAAAQLGAHAVIVQGSPPQSQRDYWQYPKTSGIAIKYAD